MWIREFNLTESDRKVLESNAWLNDQIIYASQKMLQQDFPSIYGWQSTHCDYLNGLFKPVPRDGKYIQIMLTRGNHWITVCNIWKELGSGNAEFVGVYDSLRCLYLDHKLKCNVAAFVRPELGELESKIVNVDCQLNVSDCGVYAITYATHLAHGLDPGVVAWEHSTMRAHLKSCLEEGRMMCFPCQGNRLLRLGRRTLSTRFEAVYCICWMPNDSSEPMVKCSNCSKWFHYVCMKLKKDQSFGRKWR